MIQVESQTFRRGFAFFECLDLQWRPIGRERVDSDEAGGLSVRNIKRGLLSLSRTKLPFTPPTKPGSENNSS